MPDQDPSQPTPFTEDFGDVAVALGIHPKVLRGERARLLVEGADFEYQGNRCVLTGAAVEKLRASVRSESPPAAPEALPPPEPTPIVENAAPAAVALPSGLRRARVVSRLRDFGGPARQHFPNPRVIEVEFCDENGGRAFVRVSHSRHYAPRMKNGEPMELDVTLKGGRWEASGRAPRFTGRW